MTRRRQSKGSPVGGQFAPANLTNGVSHRFPNPYSNHNNREGEVEVYSLAGARPLWGKGVTVIGGQQYGLTTFHEADIPDLMRVTGDPDILRFTMMPRLDTAEKARKWVDWAAQQPNRYAIRDGQGRLAGQVGFVPGSAPRYAEIYYWIDPRQQGKGLGAAALRYVTKAVEHDTGLIPELHIYNDNAASLRIAQKCGYVLSGATANHDNPDAGPYVQHWRRHRDVTSPLTSTEVPDWLRELRT